MPIARMRARLGFIDPSLREPAGIRRWKSVATTRETDISFHAHDCGRRQRQPKKVLLVRQSRMLQNPPPLKGKGRRFESCRGAERFIRALNSLTGRNRRWFSYRSKFL